MTVAGEACIAGAPEVLSPAEVRATAESIAAVQLPSGLIPWFPGGHADTWNHTEAAMALDSAGMRAEAEAAYRWLVDHQLRDGSWCSFYLGRGVEEPRRDTNFCAYVATGVWHHWRCWRDRGFVASMWPTVASAIDFVLRQQRSGGEVAWSVAPDGTPGDFALLAACSSIELSLRCGIACAAVVGEERPEWGVAAGKLAHVLMHRPEVFAPKDRFAMDWYYPVLSGAAACEAAQERLAARWHDFVLPGCGVRCVADRPWVTAAETAECAIALLASGDKAGARQLLGWVHGLRAPDGAYWTGVVVPEGRTFPGGEQSTYSAAAVLLAADALDGRGATAGVFCGSDLPRVADLAALAGCSGRPEPGGDPAEHA